MEFFQVNYGPFAALDANGHAKLRADLEALWSAHNQAVDGTTHVESEYLEVIATRG